MRIPCYVVAICITLFSFPHVASAQDGGAPALVRKRFGVAEGCPTLTSALAQTHEGFLWLVGGGSNLIRFDGRNFYQFETREPVGTLAVASDGDLWVSEASRLLRISSANLSRLTLSEVEVHAFAEPGLRITRLQFSKQGVLWIGTTRGLFRYGENRMAAVGPRFPVRQIREAPDGRVLVATEGEFLEIAGSSVAEERSLPARLGINRGEIIDVLVDSHDTTWYLTPLGVARESNGQLERIAPYGPNHPVAFRVHEDAHGGIWIAKEVGLFRVGSAGLELVAPSMQVKDLFNDRDGNLWVGTYGDGLYRFKEAPVRMLTTADGLPGNNIMKVIQALDGTIWAGANCGGIARFDGRRFQVVTHKDSPPSACVVGLAEDSDHGLWAGTAFGAFRYQNGAVHHLAKSDGLLDERITDILHARDGSLWFGTLDGGISRLKGGTLRTFTTADGLPVNRVVSAVEDGEGVVWVGSSQGLARLVGERFEAVAVAPKTSAFPVGGDREGGFYVTYRAGRGNVTLRLDQAGNATPLGIDIAAMVETDSGDLWVGGSAFGRVWPGQLSHAGRHDEPLDLETLSAADGLDADAAQSPHDMMLARDGTIWVATPRGVAVFDPARLPMSRAKPLIYLAGVTTGRSTVAPGPEIVLPPGTGRVEIDLAAVDISAPEKIRMQYRLDGVDPEWLNAGAVPKAVYSTLRPGRHALHIRATNRSGIWDREGVVFTVTQEPFFYQTGWFAAGIVASVLLMAAALYRRRVRQLSLAFSTRFDERLAERTRVARELHDTLLQTVQGSKLVADHALRQPAEGDRQLRALTQLSTWLGQATEEVRAAVQSLRASATETNDLAGAFRRAIDERRLETSAQVSLSVQGRPREMHPVLRDEIYRIGYEAIRNACMHARGDRVEVSLQYGRDLTWRITDNGVGIDADVIENGRNGHFGLQGMKERAARIGARLTFVSAANSGTTITLVVPGRNAFLESHGRLPVS